MKKLLTLVILAIVVGITSCQPQPSPQPSQPPSPIVAPTPSSPDLTTNAGIEATFIGTWQLDSVVEYSNDVWVFKHVYPIMIRTFATTPYDTAPGSIKKNGTWYVIGNTPTAGFWQRSSLMSDGYGKYYLEGSLPYGGFIIAITPITMIISGNYANIKQGTYYFYRKLP